MGSKKRILFLSIFFPVIFFLIIFYVPVSKPDMEFANCSKFNTDGSCINFESDTLANQQLNSIIDANNVFTPDVARVADINMGSEKMILIANSVLIDSNQKVVSNSTNKITFNPATLLDLNQNVLDLGAVQMTFEIYYKKNANVIFNGEVEIFLDGVSKGKRYISWNGQLPENIVRINVDKESRLLSDRTKSLTFTLANEGENWEDGTIHNLEIKARNLKAQVIFNSMKQDFDLGSDFTLYSLEMTVDQTKQVIFDEKNQAISIFKNDGVLTVCGEKKFYPQQANTNLGWQGHKRPNVQLFSDNKQLGTIDYGYGCESIKNIARNSNIRMIITELDARNNEYGSVTFSIGDQKTFDIMTPSTYMNYLIECKLEAVPNISGEFERWCTSNFGYSKSGMVAHAYGTP